jgi:uncharacterized protein with PCYCGC motif
MLFDSIRIAALVEETSHSVRRPPARTAARFQVTINGIEEFSMLKRGLVLACLFLVTLTVSAPWATSQQEGVVPAYNAGPPPKGSKLPPILGKENLWNENAQSPYQTHAYDLAAKIPAVLHQQPCYCYCDRMGHNSLHSCFETTHGARCDVCLKELYYSYSEHRKGKTASQIRKGIVQGEWRQVNLEAAASMN